MDFKAMLERARKRVHKVHVLYRCNKCGKQEWYVTDRIGPDIANAQAHYHDGTRCLGRFKLVARRAVLRVWCDHREMKREAP